jgi:hypothetical protein
MWAGAVLKLNQTWLFLTPPQNKEISYYVIDNLKGE